ncbi:hypothetical protein [Kitasatospora sp. NBC_00315]|uniref:hypothetical protein n=1 Tax=Kitasatospora sp. NBC_00315 TaxID=2975963 RepID=UPI0032449FC6
MLPRPRLLPVERLPGAAALALLPWLVVLIACGEDTAWIVLDALEFVFLAAADRLLRRGHRAAAPAAAVAALLLTADALVDVRTAAPGTELSVALAMALLAELPLAVACLTPAWAALRATGRGRAVRPGSTGCRAQGSISHQSPLRLECPQRAAAPSTGSRAPWTIGSAGAGSVRRYPAGPAVSRTSWQLTSLSSRAIRHAQARPRGAPALAS